MNGDVALLAQNHHISQGFVPQGIVMHVMNLEILARTTPFELAAAGLWIVASLKFPLTPATRAP
jgi:hypothetical protein